MVVCSASRPWLCARRGGDTGMRSSLLPLEGEETNVCLELPFLMMYARRGVNKESFSSIPHRGGRGRIGVCSASRPSLHARVFVGVSLFIWESVRGFFCRGRQGPTVCMERRLPVAVRQREAVNMEKRLWLPLWERRRRICVWNAPFSWRDARGGEINVERSSWLPPWTREGEYGCV